MALFQEIQTPVVTYKQPLGLFINNEFVPGIEGKTLESINPHDEKVIAAVHEATEKDVDVAVQAARNAFEGQWKVVTPSGRGVMLSKLADLILRDIQTLAAIEALNNGKAFTMATADMEAAAACLRYYGDWADKITGQTIDTDASSLTYTLHEPIGVCGEIIPWNFPMLMFAWKIGPAVATGNTVVLKTAEQTPLLALYTGQLIKEAGFPPGVINIISGLGRVAGAAISSHKDIDKIAFTGSTVVGRQIMQAAAKSNLKKVTLELGGKSPNMVFPDASIEDAISWVNFGIYYNHGQACSAGSRILVHEAIYKKFIEAFKARAEKNKVGDPFAPDTFQGPQVSKLQFDRIMNYIEQGKQDGATVVTGGARLGTQGYYIKPTIFANVAEHMSIVKEEIFGPVCTIQPFKDEEEAVRLANSSSYGLASAVHTSNVNTAIRVSSALKAGTVWINNYNLVHHQAPFGGYKESGNGRELGSYALQNYTEVKTVKYHLGGALFG